MTALDVGSTKATPQKRTTRAATTDLITVGKDVLELLSSAMYVDPLTIYREYVQNAADAIDAARDGGDLDSESPGCVEIMIDPEQRSIRIRDNGSGIAAEKAASILLSIGASSKRGTKARGFRGVGRLAGLAYARQLTFRTRALGDNHVTEIIWDCLKLKSTLRDITQTDDLPAVMERIVTIAEVDGDDYPAHFFEVELTQVVRLRKDVLLNPQLVEAYLSQVAPIPFSEHFSAAPEITAHLSDHVRMADLQIRIGESGLPLTRPHSDQFPVSETVMDDLNDLQLLKLESDGEVVAVGWFMHHGYKGHIGTKAQIGGLRLRAGNIQVGGPDLLDEIFPEVRFNGWCVGEIHVVNPRVLPNARRDNFEHNVHYLNLIGELLPEGRNLARNCRTASVERQRLRRDSATLVPAALSSQSTSSRPVGQQTAPETTQPVASSSRHPLPAAKSHEDKVVIAAGRLRLLIADLGLSQSQAIQALDEALRTHS